MRPSSRAVPPGRPPRPGPERGGVGTVRRSPRRLPLRLVDTPAPAPGPETDLDPEPTVETAPVRRRRWRWLRRSFLLIAVLVLVVECFAIARSLRSSDPQEGALPAPLVPLVAPRALPDEGSLVQSDVRSDGSIAVTQWIRTSTDIDEVALSAATPAGGAGTPEAVDGRLVGSDGTILADDITVDTAAVRIRFDEPTRLVRATYVLRGAVDASGTVDGRLRASIVSLDLDFAAEAGPTVVVVSGHDGEVLNLACANARSGVALLRPCGAPDGARWRVRLPAADREDRVTAQVDVPAA